MAIRDIRLIGESVLSKPAKKVKEITPRLDELIDDMFDTLYEHDGAGLAAPQVGILKKIAIVDIGDEDGNPEPYVLINPEVVKIAGLQRGKEGCLSVPGKVGIVSRPNYVMVKAYDRNMQPYELEGTELLARAILHEVDHLNGVMYVEKAEGDLFDQADEDADSEDWYED